jgi:HlyD family secretion protein
MVHETQRSGQSLGQFLEKSLGRFTLPVAIAGALTVGSLGTYVILQQRSPATPPPAAASQPVIATITALGRLEPQGEMIKVAAPMSGSDSRVDLLQVKAGDRVRRGQVIAVLNSRDRLQAALLQAQQQVRVAETKLAQVKAGAKSGDIAAQRSEIARLEAERTGNIDAQSAAVARLEAEVQNAQIEYQRYAGLYNSGAISASERDSKHLTLKTAQRQLQEATATLERTKTAQQDQVRAAEGTLDSIAEVRPVDVAAAQAEVEEAIAAQVQAQATLDQAYIRAPQDGQVLKIYTRPGEVISQDGIVEIGNTQQMVAVAEVYESDVPQIREGMRAQVISDSLPDELTGRVDEIGYKVLRQTIVNTDPSANTDARVVEVRIKLDPASTAKVSKLTNLQVTVTIEK